MDACVGVGVGEGEEADLQPAQPAQVIGHMHDEALAGLTPFSQVDRLHPYSKLCLVCALPIAVPVAFSRQGPTFQLGI